MSEHEGEEHSSTSDDEVFAELEKDIDEHFDMSALREQRLEALQKEMRELKAMQERGYGKLTEMTDEKEVLKTSAEKRCVIHFYHRDFKRCQVMNNRLEAIAPKYITTKFVRVLVDNVPWLVEKLGIRVLPCVICFVDGVAKERLIGFEDLGNSDTFELAALELRLQTIGVVEKFNSTHEHQGTASASSTRGIRSGEDYGSDSD